MALEQLVLIGGGGHASDMLGVIEACNRAEPRFKVMGIFDDNTSPNRFAGRGVELFGEIKDNIESVDPTSSRFLAAIGYPRMRLLVADLVSSLGLTAAAPIVHPGAAYIGTNVSLGDGTVIHAGASISVAAKIGEHSYISHGALVGHDSDIGRGAAIMPGASLSGEVKLGVGVMVGSGAVILEGIKVGDNSQIGANAVVTKDVPPNTTVVGVPAKPINK